MTSKDYEKMIDMLTELSNEYRKAAKESLKASPGEFHRLLTLSEKAEAIASDLQEVFWRKAQEELCKEFDI